MVLFLVDSFQIGFGAVGGKCFLEASRSGDEDPVAGHACRHAIGASVRVW